MTEKFRIVNLSKVLTHQKEFHVIDDTETYKRCRVQLHAKGIVLRDEIEGYRIKTKKQQFCQTGEFLVAEIDAKVGGFGIVPPKLDGAIVSSHYFLFTIDDEQLDLRFLNYYIRTLDFREQVNARGSTNYAAIRPHHVLDMTIPLPPLPEQRRIVIGIEELAAKIEEAQELRREAVEKVGMVIDSALDKIIKEGRKRKWNFVSFDSACDINPSKRDISYDDDLLVSFIPMSSVDHKSGKIVKHFVRPYQQVKKGYKWFVEGDVIFARITPCMENGKIAIARGLKNGIGFGSTEFHVFRPKKNILSEWIHCLTRRSTFRRLAELSFKGTAGQQRVQIAFFHKQEIPLPPKEKQRHIVAYLDNLQEKMYGIRRLQLETQSELDALIPSILAKAFRGES